MADAAVAGALDDRREPLRDSARASQPLGERGGDGLAPSSPNLAASRPLFAPDHSVRSRQAQCGVVGSARCAYARPFDQARGVLALNVERYSEPATAVGRLTAPAPRRASFTPLACRRTEFATRTS